MVSGCQNTMVWHYEMVKLLTLDIRVLSLQNEKNNAKIQNFPTIFQIRPSDWSICVKFVSFSQLKVSVSIVPLTSVSPTPFARRIDVINEFIGTFFKIKYEIMFRNATWTFLGTRKKPKFSTEIMFFSSEMRRPKVSGENSVSLAKECIFLTNSVNL